MAEIISPRQRVERLERRIEFDWKDRNGGLSFPADDDWNPILKNPDAERNFREDPNDPNLSGPYRRMRAYSYMEKNK